MGKTYQSLMVSESPLGQYNISIIERNTDDLPAGDVLVRVHYSSLNYKDALSATGNKGVTRSYPHTPGIDAVGVIEESTNADWPVGTEVIVTGFDLGMNTSGGFAQYIRVRAGWLVKLPHGLSLKESMIYGTAGFTASLSVAALLKNEVKTDDGTIAVSGSTGGVGSLAIAILHKLGYKVAALSGKTTASDFLKSAGATEIIDRKDMQDQSGKAMLKPRFAAAVDTVGGEVLATLLKSVSYGGTVTACGMVNGGDLPTTVFPFILRGIQLAGIDSVAYPLHKRAAIWQNLATGWKPDNLAMFAEEIRLEDISEKLRQMLKGEMRGRFVVKLD
jgi:acrylyl-CoA reductase (NADPH)